MWNVDNKKVGDRLRKLREESNASARQFAMRALIDPSQYAKIEKGELPITQKIMDRLVGIHKLDPDFLLYGKIVPNEQEKDESVDARLATDHAQSIMNKSETDSKPQLKPDPLAIIANLVEQTQTLTKNNERLTIANEALVNKALVNLSEILKVSGLSSEGGIDRRLGVQQGAGAGKLKTHSTGKKGKQKDSVSETGR